MKTRRMKSHIVYVGLRDLSSRISAGGSWHEAGPIVRRSLRPTFAAAIRPRASITAVAPCHTVAQTDD